MFNDGLFVANDITTSNIADISKKQSYLEEQRICEISELVDLAVDFALEMMAQGYDIYEVLSLLSEEIKFADVEIHEESLPENFSRLNSYIKLISSADKAIFSDLFVERCVSKGLQISELDFLQSETGDETFIYVKNPLADEAYDVFSQNFSNPRLKYSQSFLEAVLSVKRGDSMYAILPLEEKGGTRLAGVAQLIFSEDLKINSVTPVFGFEGNADMKYALVSRHFTVPKIAPDDDRYLEIRIPTESLMSLSELFASINSFALTIYRINTIYFNTEEGTVPYYSIVFKDEGKEFLSLLVFLTLFSGAYTPVGIYKNLE